MNYPYPLHSGDTIGLIAPCSPISKEQLFKCVDKINELGYRTVVGESATKSVHGYLSGNDEVRANDINQMFAEPAIDAIFCLRGGYGSTRIMPCLDYSMIKKNPKIFLGYSDVTAFHLALYQYSDLVTFHGPMVSSNMVDNFDKYSKDSLFSALKMPPFIKFYNPGRSDFHPIVPGCGRGRLIGGCLSLVSSIIGTFYEPDFTDTILFLEDVDENLPRCDKLMQQLKYSGILSKVNGVLLGNFKGCTNPYDSSYTILNFFTDFFADYDKPVLWGIQSGHDHPMGTLPLGTICTMDSECNWLLFDYH